MKDRVVRQFEALFGQAPAFVVRAPGRVNLIGEHTDYNDGFVLPIAIDRAVWIALRPRADRRVVVHSLDYDAVARFDLDRLTHDGDGWDEYVKGIAWGLQDAGHVLTAWEGVLGGDVPRGAGLSSSAAVELAVARAFAAASDLPWDAKAMARLGQRVENRWIGVNCGIMDQMISATGEPDTATLIDCRALDLQTAPLPAGTTVVVLDTGTRRGLVDSAYNERRRQCEAAAAHFGVPALRDVSLDALRDTDDGLDETTLKRARHVVSENARTLAAVDAMRAGDAARLGRLMDESHASLSDDFEVSSRELDLMVEIARAQPSCFGARMTGAGFGGCAVALVATGADDGFVTAVSEAYRRRTGIEPQLYVCRPSSGAGLVEPDA